LAQSEIYCRAQNAAAVSCDVSTENVTSTLRSHKAGEIPTEDEAVKVKGLVEALGGLAGNQLE
jgi:hypothetical protein